MVVKPFVHWNPLYVMSSGETKVSQSLVETQVWSGGSYVGSHSEEPWDEERCPISLWQGGVKVSMMTAAANIY